jgi:hypothetical protein
MGDDDFRGDAAGMLPVGAAGHAEQQDALAHGQASIFGRE